MNKNNNEQTKENGKAKKHIAIFLSALGVIGLSYGAYWGLYGSNFEDTENAYVNANQIAISSSVSGNIVGLYINDTMKVEKDFVALKVEDTDYKIGLEKAENDLAKAVRGYQLLKLNESQSNKSLSIKESEFLKAKNDFEREEKSLNGGLISKEEFENYKLRYEQAKIALDSAKLNLKNAQTQSFSSNIKTHPDVAKAIVQYRQSYIDLMRTKIKIPKDGIVAKKAINIGQKITVNQNLFVVIDEENEWVDANLKESQLKNIKIGQSVSLKSDVNGKKYLGYISSIGAGSGSSLSLLPAQNATGNWIKVVQRVPVRIELDKETLKTNGYLPMGTSMRVDIDTREIKTVDNKVIQEVSPAYDEAKLEDKINQIIKQNLGK